MLGITFEQMGKYRQSLMAFLKALHLDYESNHADMLANNVCSISSHFCLIPDTLLDRIPGTCIVKIEHEYCFFNSL